jgi:16S rRNA (cytidine1402-2'-O)-methyltransferase
MATLWILGVPLDDALPLRPEARAVLERAAYVVAESERRFTTLAKRSGCAVAAEHVSYLDNARPATLSAVDARLKELARTEAEVALLSDCGMPLLFDTGASVLGRARSLGFRVRSVPDATSWGTAAAISGFEPPFLVLGFPPREPADRMQFLAAQTRQPAALVLLDTPYRYRKLVEDAAKALGPRRSAFVGWDLGRKTERCTWGALGELARASADEPKGEFVLIVEGAGGGSGGGGRGATR